MRKRLWSGLALLLPLTLHAQTVRVWQTAPDEGLLLTPTVTSVFGTLAGEPDTTVTLDTSQKFQTVAGFGASMTEASAWALDQLTPEQKARALLLLFDQDQGIGISLLRQPMGASDFA